MISTARGTGSQSSLSASSNSNRSIHDSGTFTGVLPSRRGTHTLFTFLGKAHSSAGESAACSDRRDAHPRMHLLARRGVPICRPDEGLLPRGVNYGRETPATHEIPTRPSFTFTMT